MSRPGKTRTSQFTLIAANHSTMGWPQGMKIDGIVSVERDPAFDDEKFRSGGIPPASRKRASDPRWIENRRTT